MRGGTGQVSRRGSPNEVPEKEADMVEITEAQKAELKKLSKEARVPDMSETVTTSQEAEVRIRDLKEKARME